MIRAIWDWVRTILLAVLLGLAITAVFQPVIVRGSSMYPGVLPDSLVVMNKLAYNFEKTNRGDVVIINGDVCMEDGEGKDLIKRVVGLPGDFVKIEEGRVFVNGRDLTEVYYGGERAGVDMEEIKVNEDCVFVLGDNINHSRDSRDETVGQVEIKGIKGKAICTIYPLERMGWI